MIGAKKGTWGEFSKSIQIFPPEDNGEGASAAGAKELAAKVPPGISRLISDFNGSSFYGLRFVSGCVSIRGG
jgi:hypothetical protein